MIQETITIGEILSIVIVLGILCGVGYLIVGYLADKSRNKLKEAKE